jgi:hypothetical protein
VTEQGNKSGQQGDKIDDQGIKSAKHRNRDSSDWGSCRGRPGFDRLKVKGSGDAAWLRLCGHADGQVFRHGIMGELPPSVGHIAVAEPAAVGVPSLLLEPRLGENPQYPELICRSRESGG